MLNWSKLHSEKVHLVSEKFLRSQVLLGLRQSFWDMQCVTLTKNWNAFMHHNLFIITPSRERGRTSIEIRDKNTETTIFTKVWKKLRFSFDAAIQIGSHYCRTSIPWFGLKFQESWVWWLKAIISTAGMLKSENKQIPSHMCLEKPSFNNNNRNNISNNSRNI